MSNVDEIMAKARQMPLLSSASTRLLALLGDEDHGLSDVAKIIETDAALTARILQIVNSAAFGLRQSISTVAAAVPYVGEKLIVSLSINQSAPQVFNRPLIGYESQRGELWEHGLRTAIAASALSSKSRKEIQAGVAYTAGILHDIGKSVLSKFLTGCSPEMIKSIDDGEIHDFLEAEEEKTGVNHCKIGRELARHWRLPPELEQAIAFHHKPSESDKKYRSMVYIVHLADMVAMMGGTGTGTDNLAYSLDKQYTEYIDIDQKGIDHLLLSVMMEFEKTKEALFGPEKESEG
ncbi:MAG: HDOD domain-containing protein [Desulfobacteraceae bacterium]|nr:MAG: HDOD domain-containing protein [Desulfobacteraceae bacterium]